MDTIDCIRKRRTIRFFSQKAVSQEDLLGFIDLARLSPSGANRQSLEYIVINEDRLKTKLFDQLAWAAYVQPKRIPPANKRPVAYIIILVSKDIAVSNSGAIDAAAAIQTILLAACSKGIGSCWLGSINRNKIREIFNIPESYEINSVIALDYPAEQPKFEETAENTLEGIKYYLDDTDQLHVPKRPLSKITHINGF